MNQTFAASTLTLACLATGALGQVCGDVNGNGSVDVIDAVTLAQVSAGYSLSLATAQADADASGVLDMIDCLLITQTAGGVLASPGCAPLSRTVVEPTRGQATLSAPEYVPAGGHLAVDVFLDTGAAALAAYQLELTFDPDVVTLLTTHPGTSWGIAGGDTSQFGLPFAAKPELGKLIWNDVYAYGNVQGSVRIATVHFAVDPGCAGSMDFSVFVTELYDVNADDIGLRSKAATDTITLECLQPDPNCGDCDGNKVVNVQDVLVGAQAALGLIALPPQQFVTCNVAGVLGDASQPGAVLNIVDVLTIARYELRIVPALYCAQ